MFLKPGVWSHGVCLRQRHSFVLRLFCAVLCLYTSHAQSTSTSPGTICSADVNCSGTSSTLVVSFAIRYHLLVGKRHLAMNWTIRWAMTLFYFQVWILIHFARFFWTWMSANAKCAPHVAIDLQALCSWSVMQNEYPLDLTDVLVKWVPNGSTNKSFNSAMAFDANPLVVLLQPSCRILCRLQQCVQ